MADKGDHANIFIALCHAQKGMKGPAKDAKNPHFGNRYADLASVVDAVRGPLTDNGITWFHVHEPGDGRDYMTTILAHGASGTEIRCPVPLHIGKGDMQGYKSATTYAKRIGLESVTGVAPDDDDDGNAAAKTPPATMAPPPRRTEAPRAPAPPAPAQAMDHALAAIGAADTLDALAAIWGDLPLSVKSSPDVIRSKDARKAELQKSSLAEQLDDTIPY